MDTDTGSSKVVIDPDGDVVLVLDDDTELQVSSKVLSVASSVFKAMFGPHFMEGQDLHRSTPKRIHFPEDNADAMTIVCSILHHQSRNVNKSPSSSMLVEIGILCDKYNCSQALESWSTAWLGYYQREMSLADPETVGVINLLYPFYVFSSPDSFRQISMMAVYRTSGLITQPSMGGSLPHDVLGLLQTKKWEILCKLSFDLAFMVEPILGPKPPNICKNSLGAPDKLWKHVNELRLLGLWPVTGAFMSSSISAVCKSLELYQSSTLGGCNCFDCILNLEELAKKAGVDAMQSFKGLCLDCIKLGKTDLGAFRECPVHKKVAEVRGSAKKFRKKR